jgi:hypothetical protein
VNEQRNINATNMSGARMVRLMLESVSTGEPTTDVRIAGLAEAWDSVNYRQLRRSVDDLCEVAFVLAVTLKDQGGSYELASDRIAALGRPLGH